MSKCSQKIANLILCAAIWSPPATGEPEQWKQSIERPSRDWDYDGKRILGHIGHDICLWDATTGEMLLTMKGHKERIEALQFSPDGKHALSSSWMGAGELSQISRDTSVVLWDLETGRAKERFKGHVAGEFSPDGKNIVTFGQQPSIPKAEWGGITLPATGEVWQRGLVGAFDSAVVWDTSTGRQLTKVKLDEHSDPYWDSLHFSPDGRRFVHLINGAFPPYNSSGGALYGTGDGRELGRIKRDDVKSGGHRYTASGALASFDSTRAGLVDFKSGRVGQNIEHDVKSTWGSVWTHDGGKAVAIPLDGAIRILDIETEKMTTGAKAGTYPQRSAIVSPDNSRLAIEWGGANDVEPNVSLFDMETGGEIAQIKIADWGHLLGFSPDSGTLLIGGQDFVIYNSETGESIRTLHLLGEVDSSGWRH